MKIQNTNYQIYSSLNLTSYQRTTNPIQPKPQNNVSFRGKPWVLNTWEYGVPSTGNISANDAIKLYRQLSCGNYLDIGEDKKDYANCNKIRENNVAFLDRVTNPAEQKKFIEYYEEVTGFPNLEKVSGKIKSEFIKA